MRSKIICAISFVPLHSDKLEKMDEDNIISVYNESISFNISYIWDNIKQDRVGTFELRSMVVSYLTELINDPGIAVNYFNILVFRENERGILEQKKISYKINNNVIYLMTEDRIRMKSWSLEADLTGIDMKKELDWLFDA